MALAGKVCALPGCNVIFPVREFSYKLGDHPDEYCSSRCVHIAFDLMKRGKTFTKGNVELVTKPKPEPEPATSVKKEENQQKHHRKEPKEVKIKAEDFGDAGIIRRFCDNCGNPITLSWRGRRGEYCSNACLNSEKEKSALSMTAIDDDDEEVTDTDEEESGNGDDGDDEDEAPIRRGGTATKKAAGKKAAPAKKGKGPVAAAPAKKAAASGNSVGHSSYPDDAVITVRKRDHSFKGKRGESLDILLKKDSTTVAKFKAALEQKDLKSYAGFALKMAIENKLVAVKT
jgi:hypothetical protein